jgi:hypothetical protein
VNLLDYVSLELAVVCGDRWLFCTEDGNSRFLENVGANLSSYTV